MDTEKVLDGLYRLRSNLRVICAGMHKDYHKNSIKSVDNAIQTIRELQEQLKKARGYLDFNYKSGYEKGRKEATKWHLCSEKLPTDLEIVNVVWCNHNPPSYYQNIKDKRFVASAVYFKGKWYWYSSTCIDYLEEYGKNDLDLIDKDVEVIAWRELPKFEGVE